MKNGHALHVYFGESKGKTTAAMGLALRTVGRGGNAVIAQFLKGGDTGERYALARLPQVFLLPVPDRVKFTFALSPAELEVEQARSRSLLEQAVRTARERGCTLVVLDEVCDAVDTGLLPLEDLLSALEALPCEIVLTGHSLLPRLEDRADYITRFQKLRHPFDAGKQARPARQGPAPARVPGRAVHRWPGRRVGTVPSPKTLTCLRRSGSGRWSTAAWISCCRCGSGCAA